MKWACLLLLASCTPSALSPEYITLRIARAEHRAAYHVAMCQGDTLPAPLDEAALYDAPERHDERSRCLVVAAESFAGCTMCCGCLDDEGECGAAYGAMVADCPP